MFFINLFILAVFMFIVDLACAGAFDWILPVAITLVIVSVVGYIVYRIRMHKMTVQIRRLIWYEREHPGEVPTFLDVLSENDMRDKSLIKRYEKELAKYNRLHGVEANAGA